MKPSGHGNYERLSEHKFDKYESNFMSYCYTLEAAIRRCSAKTKKKDFFKTFTKFTGKHLYRSLFLIKFCKFCRNFKERFLKKIHGGKNAIIDVI